MKKFSFLLFASLILSSAVFAQSRNDFKGPKAKNYKYWKHDESKSAVLFTAQQMPKGPAAKNQKPWRNTPSVIESAQLVDISTGRERVTGPKVKNAKPWEISNMEAKSVAAKEVKSDASVTD